MRLTKLHLTKHCASDKTTSDKTALDKASADKNAVCTKYYQQCRNGASLEFAMLFVDFVILLGNGRRHCVALCNQIDTVKKVGYYRNPHKK